MAGGGSLFTTTPGRHIHLDPPPPKKLVALGPEMGPDRPSFESYFVSARNSAAATCPGLFRPTFDLAKEVPGPKIRILL